MKFGDYFVISQVLFVLGIATLYLFLYPTPMNFATWAAVVGTVYGAFHLLFIRDQKIPDADDEH